MPHGHSTTPRSSRAGFSLMEVMIVALILGILASLLYIGIPQYLWRARDAKRKADLHKYRTILEEYFTDKHRYPSDDFMDEVADCGSDNLSPYLDRILCDPTTRQPYTYIVSADGLNYWLYTNLADTSDPVIVERGCNSGCGPDNDSDGAGDYNYGVSSEQIVTGEFTGGVTSPPTCPGGCSPNQCGTCCPGAATRCTATGTACYTDLSCR